MAKQYYYYATNQIPFTHTNGKTFSVFNYNNMTEFVNLVIELATRNRNNMVFSDNDLRFVAAYIIDAIDFNINETEQQKKY